MLLLQKTRFLLDITDWIRILNLEAENMPPNNLDLNPAGYSILENLSQRLYKHQRIRDMQHPKDFIGRKAESTASMRE